LSNLGHVKLRLVHAYQTDYLEEGAHFDHVWRFADNGDGYMEEVHGLRDKYRADIAVLIVDDPKGCDLQRACTPMLTKHLPWCITSAHLRRTRWPTKSDTSSARATISTQIEQ
jgi:hypothetical protein